MTILPISEAAKTKTDLVAMPGTIVLPFTFLHGWTWAELAACLAAVYTAVRLTEWAISRVLMLVEWVRSRRSGKSGS